MRKETIEFKKEMDSLLSKLLISAARKSLEKKEEKIRMENQSRNEHLPMNLDFNEKENFKKTLEAIIEKFKIFKKCLSENKLIENDNCFYISLNDFDKNSDFDNEMKCLYKEQFEQNLLTVIKTKNIGRASSSILYLFENSKAVCWSGDDAGLNEKLGFEIGHFIFQYDPKKICEIVCDHCKEGLVSFYIQSIRNFAL